jgi:integrase
VREILAALDPSRPLDCRDGALLALCLVGAMRGGEVVALDWLRSGGPRTGVAGYLERHDRGLLAVIQRSKTASSPHPIPISRAEFPETINRVEQWAAMAALQPGQPIFPVFIKGGRALEQRLGAPAVSRIVRRRVQQHLQRRGMTEAEATLAAREYSSHSLRRGFLSTGAKAKTTEALLRGRARHANAEMTRRYIEIETDWDTTWGFRL